MAKRRPDIQIESADLTLRPTVRGFDSKLEISYEGVRVTVDIEILERDICRLAHAAVQNKTMHAAQYGMRARVQVQDRGRLRDAKATFESRGD